MIIDDYHVFVLYVEINYDLIHVFLHQPHYLKMLILQQCDINIAKYRVCDGENLANKSGSIYFHLFFISDLFLNIRSL